MSHPELSSPSTIMHPALSIVEILDLILQSVRDKRTMLQFALTSRAFFEFGIKNLWKTRPSPLAIFPLLPWMRQGADPKLDRKVDPQEWDRFDLYAKYIETLDFEKHIEVMAITNIFTWISPFRPGVAIFPHLSKLRLVVGLPNLPGMDTMIIFPSSLLHLDLTFGFQGRRPDSPETADLHMLQAARQLPQLKHLGLRSWASPMSLMCMAHSFKELVSCDVYGLALSRELHDQDLRFKDFLVALSSMRRLSKLALPHGGINESDIPDQLKFLHLEELSITCCPQTFNKFFQSLGAQNLRRLWLGHHEPIPRYYDNAEWRDSLFKLRSKYGHSLRALDIRLQALSLSEDQERRMVVLDPMMELHNIESFTFQANGYIRASDISAMASAWGRLKVLDLSRVGIRPDDANADGHRRPALECLVPIARSCDQLKTLSLRITEEAMPEMDNWPTIEHGLQDLSLYLSCTARTTTLISLIRQIFPRIHDIFAKTSSPRFFLAEWEPADDVEHARSITTTPVYLDQEHRMVVLKPILKSHSMKSLALHVRGYIRASDTSTMASAWCRLKVLDLSAVEICPDDDSADGHCKPALGCLIPIARSCDQLKTLTLCIVDRGMPEMENWPSIEHGLQDLFLDLPYTARTTTLISLVRQIFPRLQEILAKEPSSRDDVTWKPADDVEYAASITTQVDYGPWPGITL